MCVTDAAVELDIAMKIASPTSTSIPWYQLQLVNMFDELMSSCKPRQAWETERAACYRVYNEELLSLDTIDRVVSRQLFYALKTISGISDD